jgi:hypothetical protein
VSRRTTRSTRRCAGLHASNIDELPVLDPERPGKVLGMLRRKETIAYYNRKLLNEKRARVENEAGEAAAVKFSDDFETRIDNR